CNNNIGIVAAPDHQLQSAIGVGDNVPDGVGAYHILPVDPEKAPGIDHLLNLLQREVEHVISVVVCHAEGGLVLAVEEQNGINANRAQVFADLNDETVLVTTHHH